MSWSNVRAGIVSAIEALTPTDATRGGASFRHVDGEQIEDTAVDRAFAVRMTSPPSQVGQVLNGSSWRWLTSFEVVVRYNRGRLVEEDEDRIAQDAVAIQAALLTTRAHSDIEGPVPLGDGYAATSLAENETRDYLLTIGFTIHHL